MIQSEEGRRLHKLAEEARESGNFTDALKYTDEAMLAYQKDRDYVGLSQSQSSREIIFMHLYRYFKDPVYLLLEKHAAEVSVEIAEKSGVKEALGIPYHNLGKYYSETGEYAKAAECFRKSVDHLSRYPSEHTRPSVIADIQGHQYAAEYKNGDRSALERALRVLKQLEESDEPSSYNKNVWLSGAHLRIADMLRKDNPRLSLEHYKAAKEIIEGDNRLVLRNAQLSEFNENR